MERGRKILICACLDIRVSLLAWELGLKDVIIESDAQLVVNALTKHGPPPSTIQKVIEGTKMDLCYFNSWKANHVCRSGNSATHLMARHAKLISNCVIWAEDTLPIIANQIQYDV